MPIPTYDALMLPVLRLVAQKPWQMRDLVARIADDLALDEEERARQLPSGGSSIIASRVAWAKTYLKKAGLVDQPKRSVVQATKRGIDVLKGDPKVIDIAFLDKFEEFRAFRKKSFSDGDSLDKAVQNNALGIEAINTPEEQIESGSKALDESVRDALLGRILEASPAFFERMIVDLLLAMGYGGSRADAGKQLGGSGDGGVDGVIHEDQLGLDRVYLQAKRYKPGNSVGSEMVQAFIGALVGKGASKGVLMTTSNFTKAALGAAEKSGNLRLVLIDGDELTKLMLRFNIGVRVSRTVEIKRIDLDYFDDVDVE